MHWTVSPGSRVPSKAAGSLGHEQVGEGDVGEGDVAGVGDVEGVVMVSPASAWLSGSATSVSRMPSLRGSMVTTWGMSTVSVSSVVGRLAPWGPSAVTSAVLLTSPASMSAWVDGVGGGALGRSRRGRGPVEGGRAVLGHGRVGDGDVGEGDVAGVGDVEGVVDGVAGVGPAVGLGHVSVEAPSLSRVDGDDLGDVDVFGVAVGGGLGLSARGPSAVTSAVLLTSPASMSAWVRVWVAVHWTVSPGSRVPSKVPQSSATDRSVRVTSVRVTLPVLVMSKV